MRMLAVSGVALPAFWAALLLQLMFSVWLGWLPTSGQLSVATAPPPLRTGMVLLDALIAGQWSVFIEALRYAILPAFVLALPIDRRHRPRQPRGNDGGASAPTTSPPPEHTACRHGASSAGWP